MEGVSDEFVEQIAKDTENFSGRELFKMVVAWHDAAFMKPDPILTPEIMHKIHEKFKAQNKLKKNWTKDEEKMYEKLI